MKTLIKNNKLELFVTIVSLLVIVALPPLGVLIAFGLVILFLLIGKERNKK